MPTAAIVTIIIAVVVVLVLAAFLLTIARVLVDVHKKLEAGVIAAVGTIVEKTAPVNGVVQSIDGNLGSARDTLSSLLESKVGADGAARLVASVDPLAESSAVEDSPIRYARARQDEPIDPGEAIDPDGEPIRYARKPAGEAGSQP